jgi:hypothetical protein
VECSYERRIGGVGSLPVVMQQRVGVSGLGEGTLSEPDIGNKQTASDILRCHASQ